MLLSKSAGGDHLSFCEIKTLGKIAILTLHRRHKKFEFQTDFRIDIFKKTMFDQIFGSKFLFWRRFELKSLHFVISSAFQVLFEISNVIGIFDLTCVLSGVECWRCMEVFDLAWDLAALLIFASHQIYDLACVWRVFCDCGCLKIFDLACDLAVLRLLVLHQNL